MVRLSEEFALQIYSVVSEIPAGKVATYGQIARLAGYDKNSRLVGKALNYADAYIDIPCHRVVNHQGRVAPNFTNQKDLLISEGVSFKTNGLVDLKKHQWEA